jgi:hypothetical protein
MHSFRVLCLIGAAAIVGSAGAQVTIAPGSATFVEIALTGTALTGAFDDTALGFTSTVGNDLFPAGPVVVTTNGYIVAGASPGNAYFANGPITSTTTGVDLGYTIFDRGICAWWDDLWASAAPDTTLYWQEIAGVLYIQYQHIGHFQFNSGTIKFQVQIVQNTCGEARIHLVYPDAAFGIGTLDFGASATVGYVGGSAQDNAQWSFDTPSSIPNGLSLTITKPVFGVNWTSPIGPGSLLITVCGGTPNGAYQLLATTNQGNFPYGWLLGIDISYPDLLNQLGTPPFFGSLNGSGAGVIGPILNVPSGITVYSVAFDIPPSGFPTEISDPIVYTVP